MSADRNALSGRVTALKNAAGVLAPDLRNAPVLLDEDDEAWVRRSDGRYEQQGVVADFDRISGWHTLRLPDPS